MVEGVRGRDGVATLEGDQLVFRFGFRARSAKRSRQSRIPLDRIEQVEYQPQDDVLRVRVHGWSSSPDPAEDGCSFRFNGDGSGATLADELARRTGLPFTRIDATNADEAQPVPSTVRAGLTRGERPAPQPYGVHDQGAEALVAAWMRWMGLRGAAPTRFSADGGIDVTHPEWVAQVKNISPNRSVGRPELQKLHGAATANSKRGMFFTSGSYTRHAIDFANDVGIALFRYDAAEGTLRGTNPLA
ncbi:restriction endonuclease [Curtobacterium sp. MCBD17_040]|uniref:restriction endonuclease n=1 Tax=Curtobacterium sp. MCBD17_040 TaxID=2175674 RepID=UPI000DA6FC63|nr:restriction endonuclease [Curtobacterium sp. MCBD17_040]WIB65821.1 restriction endonuclease [Curtobacterium sp. MCBD17_040]